MTESQTYFSLSREDKIDALEVAASKLGRPADLLEKDIWVVWVLDALFDSALGEHLVFKGGTSLSKVYKAIDRFSEDVDLTYDIRQIIPDLIKEPDDPYPPSRSQAQKWTEAVRDRLGEWVASKVAPILSDKVKAAALPAETRVEGDKIYLDYDAVRSGSGYVRPSVLLEFGARSTGEPAQRHEVVCDLSQAIPELLMPVATPRVMMAERTFWEKAT
ncbi:nucleotidyl transferase AbiEii/AbiGii toxin family protein, partial [Tritonibacter mobilis]